MTKRNSPLAFQWSASTKRNAPLAFVTVFSQQSLEVRVVSQWVPNRVYFETLHRDPARSAQQSLQNFDRVSVVAKDRINLRYSGRNLLPAKGVLTLWK